MGSAALFLSVFLAMVVGPLVGRAVAVPAAAEPAALPECCSGTSPRNSPQYGLGIRDGDVLAVSFFSFFSTYAGGVVLYRIDGQRLLGHWSAPLTNGQVFEETLTRSPSQARRQCLRRPADGRLISPPSGSCRPITWCQRAL